MDQAGYNNEFEAPEGLLTWNLREEEDLEGTYDQEPSDLDFYVIL